MKKILITRGDKPLRISWRSVRSGRSVQSLHAGVAHGLPEENVNEVKSADALEFV